MWLAALVQLLALAVADDQASVPPPPVDAPPVATSAPAPILSRQALFAIPFHIDRPDRIANEPVEVQLYVSGDRGQHWDLYRKTNPAKLHFLFRAGMDGEYWFSVRTLDRSGKVRPEGPHVPGLKVIVDTTPPKKPDPQAPVTAMTNPPIGNRYVAPQGPPLPVNPRPAGKIISCQRGLGSDADKLTITWQAENAGLSARPITLAFSETYGGPWTLIAGGLENTGRYTWVPDNRISSRIFLRMEIRDDAGNIGICDSPEPFSLAAR